MFKKALAASALLMLTACGVSEVDIPVLEADIEKGIAEQAQVEVTADCPGQVDWATGESFQCDVEFEDGSTRQVDVKMLNDDGEVNWELPPAE